MAVTLTSTGTNVVSTPGAPFILQGSYKCIANGTCSTLGLPFPLNPNLSVIQFSLAGSLVTQGGLAGATRMDQTEYLVVDGTGNLYYFTGLAATVAAYTVNSTYTLNLVPFNL